ncbi:MAG: hypothetical protein D6732_05430 [Methanobacteriota archaeon]|nr:MAG: hypothetical protein D6732_05430 [Euryarchaeota archaeon]
MLQCDMTPEEKSVLREMVENLISDLSMEISHTDRMEYRETLKSRRKVLQKLLSALEEETKVEG